MGNKTVKGIEQYLMVHNSSTIEAWDKIRDKFKTSIFHNRSRKATYEGGLIYLSLYYFANYDNNRSKFAIYGDNEYEKTGGSEAHSQFTYVLYLSQQKLYMDRYFSSHSGNYEYMGTYHLLCTSDQSTYEAILEREKSNELMKWSEEYGWDSLENLSGTHNEDPKDDMERLRNALLRRIDLESNKVNNIFKSLQDQLESKECQFSYNNYEQELGKLFGKDMLYTMNELKKSMSTLCSDYLYKPVKVKTHPVDQMTYYVMKSTQNYAITPYIALGCNHVKQLDEIVVYDICDDKQYLANNIRSLM